MREISDAERQEVVEIKWEGIRRALASRTPARPVEQQDPQAIAYARVWRSTRGHVGDLLPPEVLDPSIPEHVTFALSIVGDYDAAREEPGEFADCLYRPASQLPYPPEGIRRCCELLIRIADADRDASPDRELLAREREALGLALFSLDYFLDVPENEIPRQKLENAAKPHQGDLILRSDGEGQDRIADVIGVNEKEEWMVLTSGGSSIQVVRGPAPGHWDEVKEIIAAAVSWLALTPPQGIQRL